jgi:catechol 2,3-dioxygenase-like lactoylglutathione lyase family enzyme
VVRTYGLTHLSLSVKDLERTLAFYKRVFGAKVYWRGEGEALVKTPGCHDVVAFEEKSITPLYTFASIMYRRQKWP